MVAEALKLLGILYVVEIGGHSTLIQSITACRLGGRIALIGVLTGFAGEVPTAAIMVGNGMQSIPKSLTVRQGRF